ncbi:hypothetical protein H9X96_04260 [Pedobacter sp. N36a]|uniref:DUF6266 family protein n=1 Tax=Pedobacter sp. N36a TaxID=2767996 RepID=UPI001656D63C|nr:DUF6266 family protein [Pedobacter sp. N36a]MBC8984984.1 hypothetical protein [Pedobacter sp. N36a]
MAKFNVGPYGHPSGKIGNMVFYMLNGQGVCRLIGKAGKPTIKQLANRQAMAVTMELLKPMANFINVSFKLEAAGTIRNPHNLATSYNKKHALTGEYPNLRIDYEKVVLSRGSLELIKDLNISKGEHGINLTWNSDYNENADTDDIMMVMVNHPGRNKASAFLNAGKRVDGGCFIPLDKDWMMEEQMEIYICLKSANGKLISDSLYAGNLNGAAETAQQKADAAHYNLIKTRFDQVSAAYQKKRMDAAEDIPKTKAFRQLEREYHVLKDKLIHLAGKPLS